MRRILRTSTRVRPVDHRDARRPPRAWSHGISCALLVAVSFLQQVGETTFDTKFDLTADPVQALTRSLTLWGSEANFGGLQNQAYGYLFPQGPWFVLCDLVNLPDWVAQRMWSALVLLVAYDGARRLARALRIGV